MTPDSQRAASQDGMTDSQLWRIDQICDGFETAWKSARRPRIEAFLDAVRGPDRQLLLRELLLLDIHYRRLQGEALQITDYAHRFPELTEVPLETELTSDAHGAVATCEARGHAAEGIGENPNSSSSPAEADQARTLGRFQLLERVGVGGFGTVWRALDTRWNRIAALKVPNAHLVDTAEDVARFNREARAAGQLRHPGIVTVRDVTDLNGLPILVCDFVTGMSLRGFP